MGAKNPGNDPENFCRVGFFPAATYRKDISVRLTVLTESVHKICRQNLSKIKLCDWPNKLDATSWQV